MTARRAAWSILAVAALWACADTVGPGLYHARLSIYPVFADASLLGGAGSDVDSFLVRISNPPLPDVDTTVVIPAGEDEITLTLNVPVSSALDTVTVLFRGYSSATGQLLYQGSQDVTVRPGVPTGSVPVQASYVGPGAGIDSLVLAPSAATVAPLATTQLDYTGYQGALALPDDSVPVRWVSTDTAIATVSGTGLVTGRTNGSVRIICVSVARSSVRDTAALTVGTIVQPAIGLSPSSVVFVAAAGGSPPAAQPVAVTNAGGQTLSGIALGTVSYGSGATGWLTASLSGAAAPATLTLQPSLVPSAAGSYTASVPVTASGATNSPQTVTVTYTVTGGLATKLVVTPGYAGLRPTLTQALALTATDANSNPVPTTGAVFVSRTPAVATVNSGTGLVTGVAGGTAVIVATLGSVSDSMTVAVGANGSVVASAVPDTRAFDARVVGDTVRVLVAVDLRGVSPELLGSYNAELDWNTAVLRYVRTTAVGGGFAAPTLNESLTGSGQLRFDAADANGNAGPTVGLVQVVFVANAAGATTLSFTPSEIWAAGTFNNLLPAALVYGGTVRVQ